MLRGTMFGLGFGEILFLTALALIVIGPKQLPEVARALGRMLNEFRRSANVLKDEFQAHSAASLLKQQEDKQSYEQKPEPGEGKAETSTLLHHPLDAQSDNNTQNIPIQDREKKEE